MAGELFFKWIKQHLRIKRFCGTSENANLDRHQRLRAGGVIKKKLRLNVSLHTDALRETAAETSCCGRRANRNQPRKL
jgi:IS4 transposase